MDASTREVSLAYLENNEALGDGAFVRFVSEIRGSARRREQFSEPFHDALKSRGGNLARNPGMSLKIAQGLFALQEYSEALAWLEKGGSGKIQALIKARSLIELKRYDEAVKAFEEAEAKGQDSFEAAMAIVDVLIRAGKLAEAEDKLKKVSRVGEIRAAYHYQRGRLHEVSGAHEQAMAEWEKTISLDSNHTEALFQLAYASDLYGDEEQAMELYRRCLESGPTHISALLNLAVMYEDNEDYFHAAQCVKKVLAVHPNHARAKMFLKDIESSMHMYFDEDQAQKQDKRNQVLEIPISDFELSVRSRNCLKKMNIRFLGDLLKVSESELLAYKNFGETSLAEIKTILNSKNLRLGQNLEDTHGPAPVVEEEKEPEDPMNELLSRTVGDLGLSVRARKCLQQLNLNTLADVVKCTEAELLGCKNFGMTSLQEIKLKLKEKGLNLRTLEE